MSITIHLTSDVADTLMPAVDRAVAIPSLLGGPRAKPPSRRTAPSLAPARTIEATWKSDARLVSANDTNAFAQAAHDAFYLHHPLRITPDAIWFCLAHGFAQHVNQNAETLRKRFVQHDGKEKLVVERADFELGKENPWPEAFAAFSGQIGARVGKLRELVVADFSTTGPVERAATEVLLMDAFQAYFEYEMMFGCGIPSIVLEGTPADWKSVRERASALGEFGLAGWTAALLPVLKEIERSAAGHPDTDFWRSFFRYQSGSGPSELTGWLLVLFPYIHVWTGPDKKLAWNPYLQTWQKAWQLAEERGKARIRSPEGPGLGAIPTSIASAPVKLTDVRDGSTTQLRFVAGMLGVTQDEATRALAPEFGWAIVHDVEARG